ncbi:hypothetical protein ACFL35_14180 [Candidatus Riflebacteria bacterium]
MAIPLVVLGIFVLSIGVTGFFYFLKFRKKASAHDVNTFQAEFIARAIYQVISDEMNMNGESQILKKVEQVIKGSEAKLDKKIFEDTLQGLWKELVEDAEKVHSDSGAKIYKDKPPVPIKLPSLSGFTYDPKEEEGFVRVDMNIYYRQQATKLSKSVMPYSLATISFLKPFKRIKTNFDLVESFTLFSPSNVAETTNKVRNDLKGNSSDKTLTLFHGKDDKARGSVYIKEGILNLASGINTTNDAMKMEALKKSTHGSQHILNSKWTKVDKPKHKLESILPNFTSKLSLTRFRMGFSENYPANSVRFDFFDAQIIPDDSDFKKQSTFLKLFGRQEKDFISPTHIFGKIKFRVLELYGVKVDNSIWQEFCKMVFTEDPPQGPFKSLGNEVDGGHVMPLPGLPKSKRNNAKKEDLLDISDELGGLMYLIGFKTDADYKKLGKDYFAQPKEVSIKDIYEDLSDKLKKYLKWHESHSDAQAENPGVGDISDLLKKTCQKNPDPNGSRHIGYKGPLSSYMQKINSKNKLGPTVDSSGKVKDRGKGYGYKFPIFIQNKGGENLSDLLVKNIDLQYFMRINKAGVMILYGGALFAKKVVIDSKIKKYAGKGFIVSLDKIEIKTNKLEKDTTAKQDKFPGLVIAAYKDISLTSCKDIQASLISFRGSVKLNGAKVLGHVAMFRFPGSGLDGQITYDPLLVGDRYNIVLHPGFTDILDAE